MSPAEAGAIALEEPDWHEVFEAQCARWPRLPRYLQEDSAFEEVLRRWRRFHFRWVDGKKHFPSAPEGCIALAHLRIFPPRFLIKDVPRTDEMGYQADDHMWLSIKQEQWRIIAIEDRQLHLEKRFEEPQTMQIDLNRARWDQYTQSASAMLEGL